MSLMAPCDFTGRRSAALDQALQRESLGSKSWRSLLNSPVQGKVTIKLAMCEFRMPPVAKASWNTSPCQDSHKNLPHILALIQPGDVVPKAVHTLPFSILQSLLTVSTLRRTKLTCKSVIPSRSQSAQPRNCGVPARLHRNREQMFRLFRSLVSFWHGLQVTLDQNR